MLMSSPCVLFGVLAMLVGSRSVYFRLAMLTNIVMMCRFKVVMGGCMMVCGNSVTVFASSMLFFRHLNRHTNLLLNRMIRFGKEHSARLESVTAHVNSKQSQLESRSTIYIVQVTLHGARTSGALLSAREGPCFILESRIEFLEAANVKSASDSFARPHS
jgi:hypothetical protein